MPLPIVKLPALHVVGVSLWQFPRPDPDEVLKHSNGHITHLFRSVRWITVVTSGALRVDFVTQDNVPRIAGKFMMAETKQRPKENLSPENNGLLELARVEESRPARYGFELRRFTPPFTHDGKLFRWVCVECIWDDRRKLLLLGRQSALAARTLEQARTSLRMIADGCPLPAETEIRDCTDLDLAAMSIHQPKWNALRDQHAKIMTALAPMLGAVSNKDAAATYKDFAVDMYSMWGFILPPLDSASPRQLKDYSRRRCPYKPLNRYLYQNWKSLGLSKMTAKELVEHLRLHGFDPDRKLTPKAIRRLATRLELHCERVGPRPRS